MEFLDLVYIYYFFFIIIFRWFLWTYNLYNCDDLHLDSDDITFGSLENSVSKENEVVGYDLQEYNKRTLKKMLRILRNVYNYY